MGWIIIILMLYSLIIGVGLYKIGYSKGAVRVLNEWKAWVNDHYMEE